MQSVVVVGASAAGVSAAGALREEGFCGRIVLVSGESVLPYSRPPLSKVDVVSEGGIDKYLIQNSRWYEDNDIRLILRSRATALDTSSSQKAVILDGGRSIPYDYAIIATGAVPVVPAALDIGNASQVLQLRTWMDAVSLSKLLVAGVRVVIVGAGFIGLEAAALIRQAGGEVNVIETGSAPLGRLGSAQLGSWVRNLHETNGVRINCGTRVTNFTITQDHTIDVLLSDGNVINCDAVLVGAGVRPATEWLLESHIELDERGAIRCDGAFRTSARHVYSAGDVASVIDDSGTRVVAPGHWTAAVEAGRFAALNLLGKAVPRTKNIPYFWSDQFGLKIRVVGNILGAEQTNWWQDAGHRVNALFGRHGVVTGAIAVNDMPFLLRAKAAIQHQGAFLDLVRRKTLA